MSNLPETFGSSDINKNVKQTTTTTAIQKTTGNVGNTFKYFMNNPNNLPK